MFPARYNVGYAGQTAAGRKSRVVDGKQSMLPKLRRPGSTDRASVEARRPSTSIRSSSAEPARATMAGGRLSREASASKIPMNRRSRSQQPERFAQSSMTPLRSSHLSRTTTTPVRTPSEDRQNRSWQASLERALACVLAKDQRVLGNPAWQRAEMARVAEGLAARQCVGAGGPLVRPLTIQRFIEICNHLLSSVIGETKLTNDTYTVKLPNIAKRFLYPGALSKSWLRTVNTLHAFPQALAFIAYLLDFANHIETPVSDEWLYLNKDDLARLRQDFLYKCWIRFQEPGPEFDDLDAEHLQNLKQLLGHDEQQVAKLQETIKECKATLEDEGEAAARVEEERQRQRRDALVGRARGLRAERRALHAARRDLRARADAQRAAARALDQDIASITAEIQQLKRELETQDISVEERAGLLAEVEYSARVVDSKRALAERVHAIMVSKESELAEWQERALASCVQYKQALIHLAARCPDLAHQDLAIDEQELMEARCATAVLRAVDTVRAHRAELAAALEARARAKAALLRQRHHALEETRAKAAELKAAIVREQQWLETESGREASEAASWAAERERLAAQLDALGASHDDYMQAQAQLDFWQRQDLTWCSRLAEMREYMTSLEAQAARALEAARRKRTQAVLDAVSTWHLQLDRDQL